MTRFGFDDAFLRRLERLALVARRAEAGASAGHRPTRRLGLGLDFAGHRPYAPGDDVRALDWNVYARSDRLVTRQHELRDELNLTLLVDTSASMALGRPEKSAFVRKVAAALGYVGLVRGARLSVHGFGPDLQRGPHGLEGRGRAVALFAFLSELPLGGRTNLPAAASALGEHAWHRRHRSVVVILSDFAAPSQETSDGLATLRKHGFEPALMAVSAPDERHPGRAREPAGAGTVATLEDPETGETFEASLTSEVLEAWEAAHAAFTQTLLGRARRAGLGATALDTGAPVEEETLRGLREAGLVT